MCRTEPAPKPVRSRDLYQGQPNEGFHRTQWKPLERRKGEAPPHGHERELAGKAGPHEAVERLHGLTRDAGHTAKRIGHPGPRLRG